MVGCWLITPYTVAQPDIADSKIDIMKDRLLSVNNTAKNIYQIGRSHRSTDVLPLGSHDQPDVQVRQLFHFLVDMIRLQKPNPVRTDNGEPSVVAS